MLLKSKIRSVKKLTAILRQLTTPPASSINGHGTNLTISRAIDQITADIDQQIGEVTQLNGNYRATGYGPVDNRSMRFQPGQISRALPQQCTAVLCLVAMCYRKSGDAAQLEAGQKKTTTAQTLKLGTPGMATSTGASLQGQGETGLLLRRIFQQLGYQVQVDVIAMAGCNGSGESAATRLFVVSFLSIH